MMAGLKHGLLTQLNIEYEIILWYGISYKCTD